MIIGTILPDALVRQMQNVKPALHANIARAVLKLTIKLQKRVMFGKLNGQVLKNQSGTLYRSINYRTISTPTAIKGQVGTNLSYAAIHEFGFNKARTIKAHMRTIKEAFGRPISPVSFEVGTFTRQMNMPERSFLRSALREMEDEIIMDLRAAAQEGIKL